MRETILSLLSLIMGCSWANATIRFIEENNTRLLSEHPGQYIVSDLLAELKMRAKGTKDAGIETIGMIELQNTLATLSGDQVIQNYIFKGEGQTGIVYLDEKAKKIIGAFLINTAQDP